MSPSSLDELIDALRDDASLLGPTLDPHAAFLLLRGMKNYYVRRDAQCRSAQAVAEFPARQPQVSRVRHPGLQDDPGHERARRQMHDFGTVVTFDLHGGLEARPGDAGERQVDEFVLVRLENPARHLRQFAIWKSKNFI